MKAEHMKRASLTAASLFLIAVSLSFAEGGGGIEYIGNAGSNGIPTLASRISGDGWLDVPTGSVAGFGGFGYGVTYHNFKIGGFGFGFFSGEISKTVPAFETELVGLAGGFGGVILGSQYSAGPVIIALNTRIGAGGIAVRQTSYPPRDSGRIYTIGTAALYGSADLETGLAMNRNMLVSLYAGVSGILAFTYWQPPLLPLAVPEFGVRITWGRLW
jgi:hypothetical protein